MKDDGGPAFPSLQTVTQFDEDRGKYRDALEPMGGMSLRDYFATHAPIQYFLSPYDTVRPEDYHLRAEACYRWADAMLAERVKEKS